MKMFGHSISAYKGTEWGHRRAFSVLCSAAPLSNPICISAVSLIIKLFPVVCLCLSHRNKCWYMLNVLTTMLLYFSVKGVSRSKESGLSGIAKPRSFCSFSCDQLSDSKRRYTHGNTVLEKMKACHSPPPDYSSVVHHSQPSI